MVSVRFSETTLPFIAQNAAWEPLNWLGAVKWIIANRLAIQRRNYRFLWSPWLAQ